VVALSTTDLDFYGKKYVILKMDFGSGNIDKYIFIINNERSPE